jgi:hypothetical protein
MQVFLDAFNEAAKGSIKVVARPIHLHWNQKAKQSYNVYTVNFTFHGIALDFDQLYRVQ